MSDINVWREKIATTRSLIINPRLTKMVTSHNSVSTSCSFCLCFLTCPLLFKASSSFGICGIKLLNLTHKLINNWLYNTFRKQPNIFRRDQHVFLISRQEDLTQCCHDRPPLSSGTRHTSLLLLTPSSLTETLWWYTILKLLFFLCKRNMNVVCFSQSSKFIFDVMWWL